MIGPGKCPKCEKAVMTLSMHPLDARHSMSVYKAATLNCPHCGTILGAQLDPLAIKTDIINGLIKALRK